MTFFIQIKSIDIIRVTPKNQATDQPSSIRLWIVKKLHDFKVVGGDVRVCGRGGVWQERMRAWEETGECSLSYDCLMTVLPQGMGHVAEMFNRVLLLRTLLLLGIHFCLSFGYVWWVAVKERGDLVCFY